MGVGAKPRRRLHEAIEHSKVRRVADGQCCRPCRGGRAASIRLWGAHWVWLKGCHGIGGGAWLGDGDDVPVEPALFRGRRTAAFFPKRGTYRTHYSILVTVRV